MQKPDVRKMRTSKTPKRILFISLSRPNGDATKEKGALQLISKTFRCSRVAIASVPRKHTDVSYFYVLIELNLGLLWINAKAHSQEWLKLSRDRRFQKVCTTVDEE